MDRKDFEEVARQLKQIQEEEIYQAKVAEIARLKKREKICLKLTKAFYTCEILGLVAAVCAGVYCLFKKSAFDNIDKGSYTYLEDYIQSEGTLQQKEEFKKLHGGAIATESAVGFGLAGAVSAIVTSACGRNKKEQREFIESTLKDWRGDYAVVFPEYEMGN